MPSSRHSGTAPATAATSTVSSTTATAACSSSRSGTADRLAANGVVNSVGSRGDSYDNAMAESIFGLFKTELIRPRGPWRDLDDLELAILEWIDWFNHRRLFHDLGRLHPRSSRRTSTLNRPQPKKARPSEPAR